MNTPPMELPEMDAQLAAAADGSLRDRICSRLAAYAENVRRRMNAGLQPDEFARAVKLNDALEAAGKAVWACWESRRADNAASRDSRP